MHFVPPGARRARVGLLGAGDISARYIEALKATGFLHPVAIASKSAASAEKSAAETGLTATTADAMLASPEIDYVINLAPPLAHFELTRRALQAGKHVYSEKPICGTVDEANELAALARERGLLLACAPATFLGPALQTARSLIDGGGLGEIVGARVSIVYPGPDRWHHNPDHLFDRLGGPLFDMGVYHLSAIVALLGPVDRVQAFASRARNRRKVRLGPRAGEDIAVRAPTHVTANLQLRSGALVSAIFSFDGFGSLAPGLEVFGTKAVLAVDHPSQFDGDVKISREPFQWTVAETVRDGWSDDMWAIGPAEAWIAHGEKRSPRTSAAFATHLLEVLSAIEEAAILGSNVAIASTIERPEPLQFDYRRELGNMMMDQEARANG
jgi:predicted dehydrogenase